MHITEIKAHRQQVYEQALDRLIAGKAEPEYVKMRFKKLKRVKEK